MVLKVEEALIAYSFVSWVRKLKARKVNIVLSKRVKLGVKGVLLTLSLVLFPYVHLLTYDFLDVIFHLRHL